MQRNKCEQRSWHVAFQGSAGEEGRTALEGGDGHLMSPGTKAAELPHLSINHPRLVFQKFLLQFLSFVLIPSPSPNACVRDTTGCSGYFILQPFVEDLKCTEPSAGPGDAIRNQICCLSTEKETFLK